MIFLYNSGIDDIDIIQRGFHMQGASLKSSAWLILMAAFLMPSLGNSILFAQTSKQVTRKQIPRLDLHVHLEGGQTIDGAAKICKQLGVKLGIVFEGGAGWGVNNDAELLQALQSLEGRPFYKGFQVYGSNWQKTYSPQTLSKLDYLVADALIFPDKGKSVYLWEPGVTFADPDEFMERYVDENVRVLSEPIDVWANPTYLPASLAKDYDRLWTPARMKRVIDAAVKNSVAIEINSRFRVPSPAFIRMAKQAGAKFSFGSNSHGEGVGVQPRCTSVAAKAIE
jgi:hypothetical protein